MIKKIFFILLCSTFIVRMSVGQPQTKDEDTKWRIIGYGSDGEEWRYDSSTLKKKGSHCFVWVKMIPNPDSLKSERLAKMHSHNDDVKWLNYSHSLTRWEINCEEDFCKLMSRVSYGTNGGLIENFDFDEAKFTSIIPGTLVELLEKKVCK